MPQALAEALTGINDPDRVQRILDKLVDNESTQSSQDHPTLSAQYEAYLARRQNRSPSTRAQYKRTIPTFVAFSAERDITQPSDLTADLADSYVDELFEEHETDATIYTYTKNVRAWLRWLSRRGHCESPVFHVLDKDELGLSPTARDEALPKNEAKHLLTTLTQQRRGTAKHALIELLWNAGPRIGGLHSSDLKDFKPETDELYIQHRPEVGTRLKNGNAEDEKPGDGERIICLHPRVTVALKQYVRTTRSEVTDEYGREPLFTTSYGRAVTSTLRRWVYEATSCRWLQDGPTDIHCDGSCDPDSNVCQHSYYPHAIRRGAIVDHLSGGLRPDRAAGRFDVSTEVIKKHYDPRTHQQRKNDREKAVRDAWSDL